MSYIKAQDVLPKELILEIQKYIDGGIVYIPRTENKKKSWGEKNGTKTNLKNRNSEIYHLFTSGISRKILGEKFYLSQKTISKIVSNEKKLSKNHES